MDAKDFGANSEEKVENEVAGGGNAETMAGEADSVPAATEAGTKNEPRETELADGDSSEASPEKRPAKPHKPKVRPIILICLAAACVLAVGSGVILYSVLQIPNCDDPTTARDIIECQPTGLTEEAEKDYYEGNFEEQIATENVTSLAELVETCNQYFARLDMREYADFYVDCADQVIFLDTENRYNAEVIKYLIGYDEIVQTFDSAVTVWNAASRYGDQTTLERYTPIVEERRASEEIENVSTEIEGTTYTDDIESNIDLGIDVEIEEE